FQVKVVLAPAHEDMSLPLLLNPMDHGQPLAKGTSSVSSCCPVATDQNVYFGSCSPRPSFCVNVTRARLSGAKPSESIPDRSCQAATSAPVAMSQTLAVFLSPSKPASSLPSGLIAARIPMQENVLCSRPVPISMTWRVFSPRSGPPTCGGA